jgi:hypothetical protein
VIQRLLIAVLLVAAVVGGLGFWRWKAAIPVQHKIVRAARYHGHSADELWKVATDFGNSPQWRSDLKGMEALPKLRGHEVWRETWADGRSVTLETVESLEGRRMVRCVVDQGGDFGGCWTFEIYDRDGGDCAIAITEGLTIHSSWMRLTTTTNDRKAFLDTWLQAIGTKLGDPNPRFGDSMVEVSRPPKTEAPPAAEAAPAEQAPAAPAP